MVRVRLRADWSAGCLFTLETVLRCGRRGVAYLPAFASVSVYREQPHEVGVNGGRFHALKKEKARGMDASGFGSN